MKKALMNIVVLLGSLLLAAILLHAMDLLMAPEIPHTVISPSALAQGNLHQMIFHQAFWRSFPSTPDPAVLFHWPSLFVIGFLLAHGIYIWGVKKQLSPLPFGIVIWLYGLAPYGLGFWILKSNGQVTEPASLWTMMLLGILCSTLVCSLSILLGLMRIDVFKTLTRVPLPHVRFKTQPVAES